MLMELGYFDDIDKICEKIPPKTQTMVFSATLEQSLKAQLEHSIGSSFLYEGEANKTSSRVAHHLVNIKHVGVFEALIAFLEIRKPYLAMVFASKKETVNEAASFLKSHGYDCLLFTGDLDVRERKQALRKIKANSHSVIVCSDVLSRGMDIEDVTDVISLDLPTDLTYYFHRAGRTGRFDKSGDSWVFYNADSVAKPKALLSRGVIFDYYVLKGETLDVDPKGLEEKKRVMKSTYSEDENKEIMKARGRAKGQKVRPGYKKKTKAAVEKVKRKYRRKAIQAAVKKHKDETYARKAKKKK